MRARFGQMSLNRISDEADYLQLDICGLRRGEAVARYLAYNTTLPVVLHGDWEKKGNSENNLRDRFREYVGIIQDMKTYTEVLGFTMHPPSRTRIPFQEFVDICKHLEGMGGTPVFIENRSSNKKWLSIPSEIIAFSKRHNMTIDLPQLYIAAKFDSEEFVSTLTGLCWDNIKELHVGNVKHMGRNTMVGRKIGDGEIDYKAIIELLRGDRMITLEILGGIPSFEAEKKHLLNL